MSRIHEALKKAELERTTGQGGTVEPLVSVPVQDTVAVADSDVTVETMPAAGPTPVPVFPSQSGVESLLARSAPMQWNPDPAMLFFNGDDSVRGTEEFRTLRTRLNHLQSLQPLHTLVVTSPSPAEGKTFSAASVFTILRA